MKQILLLSVIFLLYIPICSATVWINEADCEGAWLFEDSGDPYNDNSAAGNDGTAAGNPTHATASPPAGVNSTGYITLDGDDSIYYHSHIPDYDDLTVGTIVCYVNLSSFVGIQPFFSYTEAVGTDEVMYFQWNDTDNEIEFLIKGNNVDVIDGKTNTSGIDWEGDGWHHFAYDTDTNHNKIYMDGVDTTMSYDVGSGTSATRAFFDDLSDAEVDRMYHARAYYGGGTFDDYITGDIDECAIFSSSHDSTEINDIMDNGLNPSAVAARGQVIMIY